MFSIFLTLVLLWQISTAYAKDLGVYGETFPLQEANLLTVLQDRLQKMEKTGDLHHHQQTLAQQAAARVRQPIAVPLLNTVKARQWTYDPRLIVAKDIKDARGHLVAAKGTVINPLDTVSWGVPLLFLNGDDPAQMTWAHRQCPDDKWVLVKGNPLSWEEQRHKPVYFDQGGVLVKRLGIQQVPCRVKQQGTQLHLEEILVPERTP